MTATVYFLLHDSCLPFERKRYCKHGYIVLSFHLLVFEEEIGYREAFWFSSGELKKLRVTVVVSCHSQHTQQFVTILCG